MMLMAIGQQSASYGIKPQRLSSNNVCEVRLGKRLVMQTLKSRWLQLQPNRLHVCRHCRHGKNNVCAGKPAPVVILQTLQTLQTLVRVPSHNLAPHSTGTKCRKVWSYPRTLTFVWTWLLERITPDGQMVQNLMD